jgi:hypothetical protein
MDPVRFGALLLPNQRAKRGNTDVQSVRDAKARSGIIHGAELRQEARSENDDVVASTNGWSCVGTKHANMQVVSQRG